MELFDVIDSKGNPAGQIVSRKKPSRGIPIEQPIWIIRKRRQRNSFTETLTKQGFFSGKI